MRSENVCWGGAQIMKDLKGTRHVLPPDTCLNEPPMVLAPSLEIGFHVSFVIDFFISWTQDKFMYMSVRQQMLCFGVRYVVILNNIHVTRTVTCLKCFCEMQNLLTVKSFVLTMCVLVNSSCHNKIPQAGWLNNRHLFFHSPRVWKFIQDQGANTVEFSRCWLPDSCPLAVSSPGREKASSVLFPLIRTLTPSTDPIHI